MADSEHSAEGQAADRRVYYDHEPVWRTIAESDGRGWDDLPEALRPLCDDTAGDAYTALERFLISRWAPLEGARALDLGCGGGQSTIRLAEHGYEAVGIDYSETAIDLARENAQQADVDCEFIVADALDLEDFDDRSFDLVVDNHCLHCLIEPEHRRAFLEEAERVLRPGGVFFSETMTREGTFDPELLDVDPDTFISRPRTRIWVSKFELGDELRQAGFNVMQTYTRRQPEAIGLAFVNSALSR